MITGKPFLSSFSAIILFMVFAISGITIAQLIPFQLLPNSQKPVIIVNLSWPNASSLSVEQQVTSVLEGEFNFLREVKAVRSTTSNGKATISITFTDDVDMNIAQFEVSSIIRNKYSFLPVGVKYPFIEIEGQKADEEPVLVYAILTPPGTDFHSFFNEKVVKKLARVEGVEKAEAFFNNNGRVNVKYDFYKMVMMDVSSSSLRNAIQQSQTRYPLGKAVMNGEESGVILQSQWQDTSGWESLPLKYINDKVIRLSDVAGVSLEESSPSSYYRINGASTNNLLIYSRLEENQLDVVRRVKKEIEAISSSLPEGCTMMLTNDPTQLMKDELTGMNLRAGCSLLILLLLAFLFTRSWKYLSIILICLVANLTIPFIFYYFFKVELHIYSLAGITISFGLLVSTNFVMIDHLRYRRNGHVFIAILASTLATVTALAIVFLLSERLKVQLLDFVKIVIINLAVSLPINLLLIPALIDRVSFHQNQRTLTTRRKRVAIRMTRLYEKLVFFLIKRRTTTILCIILAFGFPVFLLPSQINSNSIAASIYNHSIGSTFYNKFLRLPVNVLLGGSLRLFVSEVDSKNYFNERTETRLVLNAVMPEGANAQQLNEVFYLLEGYLKQFKGIEKFESVITGPTGRMIVYFKPELELTGYPAHIHENLTTTVLSLGSAEWEITGLGEAFNNVLMEKTGSLKIKLRGYNYDELLAIGKNIKQELLENPRIKEVNINNRNSLYKKSNEGYILSPDKELLSLTRHPLSNIYQSIKILSGEDEYGGAVNYNGLYKDVSLTSSNNEYFTKWNLSHDILYSNGSFTKLSEISNLEKEQSAISITKDNQNFQIYLDYDFIGPSELGDQHLKEVLAKFFPKLPMGYTAESENTRKLNSSEKKEQNFSLLIVVAIVFFICAILFESLTQPFIIIMIIPFTFIGVFITYYFFNINFNNGGYAAFMLLSGLTVSSIIYIINQINSNLKSYHNKSTNPLLVARYNVKVYMRAFNSKIVPLTFSILSIALGLVPFLLGVKLDTFWHTLITGIIGGITFSMLAIFFYLPLFLIRKKDVIALNTYSQIK